MYWLSALSFKNTKKETFFVFLSFFVKYVIITKTYKKQSNLKTKVVRVEKKVCAQICMFSPDIYHVFRDSFNAA